MAGSTSNSIEIHAPRPFVYGRTNDLQSWTQLFTEYASVAILKTEENYFVFRLTTQPDEDGKSWSWISWRRLYPDEWRIEAARIEPLTPFSSMDIHWYYEEQGSSTIMRWNQEFTISATAGFREEDAIAHINQNTKVQMETIKERLEVAWRQTLEQTGASR